MDAAPNRAWTELDRIETDRVWAELTEAFRFRPSVERFPGIIEPTPSVTLDLSGLTAGDRRSSDLTAEALRAFVAASPQAMFALDWQHPCYRFSPTAQAAQAPWPITVLPDGDYHLFLAEDLTEGTFAHPWERTLCVFGPRLVGSLGAALSGWLPVLRSN